MMPYCHGRITTVATAPTVYGIETNMKSAVVAGVNGVRCNSTYRLRY